MPLKTDKSVLKQYFRSGSRPTQKQFYDLIDNCYNEGYTSFVSGYQVLMDTEKEQTIHTLKREAGKTVLVPFFDRINTQHSRMYQYAIPVSNVGQGFTLDKVLLDISLPKSTVYSIRDRSKEVSITLTVKIEDISVYNGAEKIYSGIPDGKIPGPVYEIGLGKTADQWQGISIDIRVLYNITSDIAVSDQLDISAAREDVLEHQFGSAGGVFSQYG